MPPAASASASSEITGQTALPISRIKKIIQLDEEIVQCSQNATFLVTMATEMFIRYLVEQGHKVVKSERKPRKLIQYKDLATAVSRIDNLEFLSDVIPKTTTYKQFKERKAKEAANHVWTEKGQRTLAETLSHSNRADDEEAAAATSAAALNGDGGYDGLVSAKSRQPTVTHASGSISALMVHRTVEHAASTSAASSMDDTEMEG